MARSGYTLPVFAVAAAKAACLQLLNRIHAKPPVDLDSVLLELLPGEAAIPIQQVASLTANSALAIALSDPGDNLDLTRNTPIWAYVEWLPRQTTALILAAGEGIGKTAAGEPAIYRYARQLFDANLLPLISPEQTLKVTIVMPEGRQLAQRTSNAAFGVLEGLSLLGTSGISQPLSAADHLEELRQVLQTKLLSQSRLIFCIGSNGFQVAEGLGLPIAAIAQTGNWLGAMLVEAGLRGAESVLLLGYHGKLIKLAGGIFNTSSHLADAKLEIMAAAIARVGGNLAAIQAVLAAPTAEAAAQVLKEFQLAGPVFEWLATTISAKAQAYVHKYANVTVTVGTVLFDRQGQIVGQDAIAQPLINQFLALQSSQP